MISCKNTINTGNDSVGSVNAGTLRSTDVYEETDLKNGFHLRRMQQGVYGAEQHIPPQET